MSGSSPDLWVFRLSQTKDFKILFHKQFFVIVYTRHRRDALAALL
jgi:hypothetical protein